MKLLHGVCAGAYRNARQLKSLLGQIYIAFHVLWQAHKLTRVTTANHNVVPTATDIEAAKIAAADAVWEETIAAGVLQLFRADVSRRTLADPSQPGTFYFQPNRTGSVDPLGRSVPPPSLPSVIPKRPTKHATSSRMAETTGTQKLITSSATTAKFSAGATLPKLGSTGSVATMHASTVEAASDALEVVINTVVEKLEGASPLESSAHSMTAMASTLKEPRMPDCDAETLDSSSDHDAVSADEEVFSAGYLKPVKLPAVGSPTKTRGDPGVSTGAVNRHGMPVSTSGGGGNSTGIAKLRDGPYSIWFLPDNGSFTSKASWCGVATIAAHGEDIDGAAATNSSVVSSTCSHSFCKGLSTLEVAWRYTDYVSAIETLLKVRVERQPRSEAYGILWRQLIVAGAVFSARATDHREFPVALSLVRQAEHWITVDLDMTSATRKELTAFCLDAYAYYLFHRNQLQAALDCTRKASKLHLALAQYDHVRVCLLCTCMRV